MTTSIQSLSISSQGSLHSSENQETKKYLLLRDTVAKSKWPLGAGSRSRLLSKRSEQRVLKGSLWQQIEDDALIPRSHQTKSLTRSASTPTSSSPVFKLHVESIEIEDLQLQCAAGFLTEISGDMCRLLLAIPTSEERYLIHSDHDRISSAKFINVGSDVIVSKRNIAPCRGRVKWKGRLAGKQGVWFGVEIMDEQSQGSGDSDGSINNIRLFTCDKNNGMFVNIGQITLVPPKRPQRRMKKRAPSSPPSRGSQDMLTNGSHTSDVFTNDLVSQTESELSFDVTSAETMPLVDIQVNDRVMWPSDNGLEEAVVRWVGTLPDEESLQGEILVGVEFDNPIGKGTGVYKNKRLFEAKKGHASLVPLEGLVKTASASSLKNQFSTSSLQSLPTVSSQAGRSGGGSPFTAAAIFNSLGIEDTSDHNNNGSSAHKEKLNNDNSLTLRYSPTTAHTRDSECPSEQQTPSPPILTHASPHILAHASPPILTNGFVKHSDSTNSLSSTDEVISNKSGAAYSSLTRPSKTLSVLDDNGWYDSCDSVPHNEHLKHAPQSATLRQHDDNQLMAMESPSINHKARRKNGLLGLHSLHADDINDIMDELSLESANDHSLESIHDKYCSMSDSYPVKHGTVSSSVTAEPDELTPECQCHSPDMKYVLAKLNSASNSSIRHCSHSMTPPRSDDGSDSPHVEDGVLSPLTERTTPTSHSSSVDHQLEEELVKSHVFLPTPLKDLSVDTEDSSMDLYVVPEPPPEFMTTYQIHHTHEQKSTALWKGIACPQDESSFMEAILFQLSVSTDILCNKESVTSYTELRDYLLEHITLPIRSGRFVESTVMTRWRHLVNEISTGQLLRYGSIKEFQRFINMLLQHICKIPPLYELNNEQTGYTMTLITYKDARIGFPTVQKLLEKTCIQQQVKLSKVPNHLILILPRWDLNKEKVFPNLHIDLTDVLEYANRICHMCGGKAVFECPECYQHESTELSAAAFCEPCSQTIHKHSKRLNHMPVQLKLTCDVPAEEGSILRLQGLLCVEGDHYTSLSAPPRQYLTDTNVFCDEPDWIYFDCQAASRESTVPPYMQSSPQTRDHMKTSPQTRDHMKTSPQTRDHMRTANWLTLEAYEHMARDLDNIPDNIITLLENCCMCLYTKQ